jgi:hypothetical protein
LLFSQQGADRSWGVVSGKDVFEQLGRGRGPYRVGPDEGVRVAVPDQLQVDVVVQASPQRLPRLHQLAHVPPPFRKRLTVTEQAGDLALDAGSAGRVSSHDWWRTPASRSMGRPKTRQTVPAFELIEVVPSSAELFILLPVAGRVAIGRGVE